MPFHLESELATSLTEPQRRQVLSVFPQGTVVEDARFFDNYDLPCPIRVRVRLPDSRFDEVVMRSSRHGDSHLEAEVLRTLHRLGLPVPRVLAEGGPDAGCERGVLVLSRLPGENLQALATSSPPGLEWAQALLIEAVERLSSLTAAMEREPVAALLPRCSLAGRLHALEASGSAWWEAPEIRSAIGRLERVLEGIAEPLVFTNGDYQPGNFLAEGGRITGFVDFESAGFTDPLIGFAKYPVYDIHPWNRAGFIDRLLEERGWTRVDFAPRLALGCLETLCREVPLSLIHI